MHSDCDLNIIRSSAVDNSTYVPRVNALMRLCAKWTDSDRGLHVEFVGPLRFQATEERLLTGTPMLWHAMFPGRARSLHASSAPRRAQALPP